MRRMRLYLIALVGSVSMTLGGCSWLVVKGPPAEHATLGSFECTEGRAVPILDGLVAALGVVAGAYIAITEQDADTPSEAYMVGAIVGVTVGGAGAWSSYTGFRRTRECRDARRVQEERLRGR